MSEIVEFGKWWDAQQLDATQIGLNNGQLEMLRRFCYLAFIDGRESGVTAMHQHWVDSLGPTIHAMEQTVEQM